MDPSKWTQKTIAAVNAAQQLASEHGHQQITPIHLCIVLFEDPEGLGKQAILNVANEETLRSILRLLKKQVVRLPSIDPPPEQAELSPGLRKVLQQASKLQKQNNDGYLGVDTLLSALLESKDIATTLEEAGAECQFDLAYVLLMVRRSISQGETRCSTQSGLLSLVNWSAHS